MDESLVNSNKTISNCTRAFNADIKEKLEDPTTSYKAKIWQPKAMLIQELSKYMYNYLEGLRSDLKKEAGLKMDEGAESFRGADKNAVIRLFDKKGKGKDLYGKLRMYKTNMLAIDSELANAFNNEIMLTTVLFDSTESKQDFTKTFFDDIPTVAALAMLSQFQNSIINTENRMIVYCNNKIPAIEGYYRL